MIRKIKEMFLKDELKQINEMKRSYDEFETILGQHTSGKNLPRYSYLNEIPDTRGKRLFTFTIDDDTIEDMTFEDRCVIYQKMYQNSYALQRGFSAIASDCMNTYPLIDLEFDEKLYLAQKKYRDVVSKIRSRIEYPNEEDNRNSMLFLSYMDLLWCGNCFWQNIWNVDRSNILYHVRLRPETMRIWPRLNKRTNSIYYYYLQKVGTTKSGDNMYYAFTEDHIIHYKVPNILNPLYGLSRLEGLMYLVYMDINSQKYQSKFFKNGITPGTMIAFEEMSEDDELRFNETIDKYSNNNEPFTTMFIPGKDVKIINRETIKDLDLCGFRKTNVDEIYEAIGIPPVILSRGKLQVDRQDTPYDSYIRHTVAPLQNIITDTYTDKVIRKYEKEKNIKLVTGSQIVPGTLDAAEFVLKALQARPMTLNEVSRCLGMALLEEGGDLFVIYTPNGLSLIEFAYNMDTAQREDYPKDPEGKPINPGNMFSKVNLKVSKPPRIYRDQGEYVKDLDDKIYKNMEMLRDQGKLDKNKIGEEFINEVKDRINEMNKNLKIKK